MWCWHTLQHHTRYEYQKQHFVVLRVRPLFTYLLTYLLTVRRGLVRDPHLNSSQSTW